MHPPLKPLIFWLFGQITFTAIKKLNTAKYVIPILDEFVDGNPIFCKLL